MRLRLVRKWWSPQSTIGELYIDELYECVTLEDYDRNLTAEMSREDIAKVKVFGQTAIPRGTSYRITLDWSPRFQRVLPHILEVPGFIGVRFHAGNDADDTDGCVLVGMTRSQDHIGTSRVALDNLMAKLRAVPTGAPCTLEIVGAPKA